MRYWGLDRKEVRILRSLNTPSKIQTFIDELDYNHESEYFCKSPRRVLQEGNAHCMEGALLAAAARRINHMQPYVMDLVSAVPQDDHVVALHGMHGKWGTVGQSKYHGLTWRDPIFKTLRELAMSFTPVYVLGERMTLRSYAAPINLARFDHLNWMVTEECLDPIGKAFGDISHQTLMSPSAAGRVRPVPRELERKLRNSKK